MSTLLVDQVRDNMPNVKIEVIETAVNRQPVDAAFPELGYKETVWLSVRYIDEAGDVNFIEGEVGHDWNTLVWRGFCNGGRHICANPCDRRPSVFFSNLNDAAKV